MTHITIESISDYLQWDKADWRAYFRTHGQTIKNDYNNDHRGITELFFQQAFQEQMIKVGIFGKREIYDQIPSRWSIEINPTPATIIGSAWGGGPQDFTRITSVATRLIMDHDDDDDGVLIKLLGQKEPLYLVRGGSYPWDVQTSALTRYPLFWRPEDFEAAAEAVELAQAREVLETDFLQDPALIPALWQLVASYVSDAYLTLDPDAQQKRQTRQQLSKVLDEALNTPVHLPFPISTQVEACNIVSALLADSEEAPEKVSTVLADSHVEEAPEKEVDSSWASTISQVYSSLCEKLSSLIRWCLSFFS